MKNNNHCTISDTKRYEQLLDTSLVYCVDVELIYTLCLKKPGTQYYAS